VPTAGRHGASILRPALLDYGGQVAHGEKNIAKTVLPKALSAKG